MSTYLAKADFLPVIRAEDLNELIDATDATLDTLEAEALSMVKNYIGKRYDIDAETEKTGADRNSFFIAQIRKIVIYNLFRRAGVSAIPEPVNQDYADAMDWLEKVARAKLDVDLDVLQDSEGEDITRFRWGSQSARTH